MKKIFLFTTLLLTLTFVSAKAQTNDADKASQTTHVEATPISSLRLDINTMTPEQASKIKDFISSRQTDRGFWLVMGKALISTLASNASMKS